MSGRWRLLLAAGSWANLCLMFQWTGLLTFTNANRYLMKLPPRPAHYLAGLTTMLILAGGCWLWLRWIERSGGPRRRCAIWVFLMFLLVPANALREVVALSHPMLKGELLRHVSAGTVWAGVLAAAALLAVVGWVFSERFYQVVMAGLVIASPAVAVSTVQALHRAASPPSPYPEPQRAHWREAPGEARRVVWVVFDEADERLLFRDRPPGLELPEFDRLARESFSVDRAESPSRGTLSSIPALLAGKKVVEARPGSDATLHIRYEGEQGTHIFSAGETVFGTASRQGWNAAAAGWYHPYCKMFGSILADCWREEMPFRTTSVGTRYPEIVGNQLRSLLESSLMSPFGQSVVTRQSAVYFERLQEHALRMAGDGRLQLVFLHLQPPHAPHFYDRKTNGNTLANAPLEGYLDSMALADRTLGRLRRKMEDAGLWEKTTLIVTSDHPYRTRRAFGGESGKYVPFLVHTAGQRSAEPLPGPFRTVDTAELAIGVLKGEMEGAEPVGAWLRARQAPAGR